MKDLELTIDEQVLIFYEALKIDLKNLGFGIEGEEYPNIKSEGSDFQLKLKTKTLKSFRIDFFEIRNSLKAQIFYLDELNSKWVPVLYKQENQIHLIQGFILQIMEGLLNLENNLK